MIILYILAAVLTLVLACILFLIVCSLLVNPEKEYETHSPFYRRLLDTCTAIAMKLLRIQVHVTGMEKVPTGTGVLFVGNHRSNFDPIITWHVFRKWQIAYISKASNFKIPIFGRFIRKCCFMAIDREDPRKAIVTINKAARLLNAQEVSIGVYPEGTRSKTGVLLPFHNGVFKIAQKAGSPIVVVSILGTEMIHKRVPFRTTHVYLDVLDVIPPEQLQGVKTDVIGHRVSALLQDRIQKEVI